MELCLLRNKCYMLYSDEPSGGYKSFVRPNKYVVKYATHGFQGGPKILEELIMHNKRKYSVEKPNTLRISVRQGRVPNKFEKRDLVLRAAPIKAHFNHNKEGK